MMIVDLAFSVFDCFFFLDNCILSFLLRMFSIENCRLSILFCIINFLCDLGLSFDAASWITLFLESNDETFNPLFAGPKCIIFFELCFSSTGNVASFPVVALDGTAAITAGGVSVSFVSGAAAGACGGCRLDMLLSSFLAIKSDK